MAKISGTVKWFSNKKGFGFLAPTSDNAPTSEEIFVHHSSLQMADGAYRTLVSGNDGISILGILLFCVFVLSWGQSCSVGSTR